MYIYSRTCMYIFSLAVSGPSWGRITADFAHLRTSWDLLGPLGPSCALRKPSWAVSNTSGAVFKASRAAPDSSWAVMGLSWDSLGALAGHLGVISGAFRGRQADPKSKHIKLVSYKNFIKHDVP